MIILATRPAGPVVAFDAAAWVDRANAVGISFTVPTSDGKPLGYWVTIDEAARGDDVALWRDFRPADPVERERRRLLVRDHLFATAERHECGPGWTAADVFGRHSRQAAQLSTAAA